MIGHVTKIVIVSIETGVEYPLPFLIFVKSEDLRKFKARDQVVPLFPFVT